MSENPSFWDKHVTPPSNEELNKLPKRTGKPKKLVDCEEVSFTFRYDPVVLNTIYGPTLNRGEIFDEYYGHFNVPEGGRGLCYAVTGIYLL